MTPGARPEGPGALLGTWHAGFAAAGAHTVDGRQATWGDTHHKVRIASVSKLVVAYACLVAVEEGALGLDDPAGPRGSTVRHLLSHASGLDFDSERLVAPPGTRRIYSNTGFEQLADHLAERTGIAWSDYVTEAVLSPLGMHSTVAQGSAARDLVSDVADLMKFLGELLRPQLVDRATLLYARRPQFPDLVGVLPGFGRQDPCPWGLGFEVRDGKAPHWTGSRNSADTFGHFGGSGTFLWVDPASGLGLVALSDREFGPWAVDAWPRFSDAVIAALDS